MIANTCRGRERRMLIGWLAGSMQANLLTKKDFHVEICQHPRSTKKEHVKCRRKESNLNL